MVNPPWVWLGGVETRDSLRVGYLILIPVAFLLVAFFAFGATGGVAAALRLLARVLEDPALGLFDETLANSALGNWAETGIAGIGISPSMLGMGAMKLSRAYDQEYEH
jgi:hypothetical protein